MGKVEGEGDESFKKGTSAYVDARSSLERRGVKVGNAL